MATFFHLLDVAPEDKSAALAAAVRKSGPSTFEIDPAKFCRVPGSPFAYWVSDNMREAFVKFPRFDEGRVAQRALSTNDDFRYLRLWIEREPDTAHVRPASGWLPFAKGGEFSAFYADVPLLVKWLDEGRELEADAIQKFPYLKGNVEWVLHRECNYLRPGLTWPIKNRFSFKPRCLPRGCIFAHVGPSAFVPHDGEEDLLALQAVMSSSVFTALVRVMAGWNFEVGVIQRTPVPTIDIKSATSLSLLARRGWRIKWLLDTNVETSHSFILPASLERRDLMPSVDVDGEITLILNKIDAICLDLYGINAQDRSLMTPPDEALSTDAEAEPIEDTRDLIANPALVLSWGVGVAFARFDIRLATGERAMPPEPDPFDPLPAQSPGMLPDGDPPFMPTSGVFVDDPGHADDLAARVTAVYEHVGEAPPAPDELRRTLAKDFFPAHIRMYSKSRRKAPIYWQLATPSASYSVWLYIHAFGKDTLFRVQNDYLAPKLRHERLQLDGLRAEAGPSPTPSQTKAIDAQSGLVEELSAMLDEVKRVAPLWDPDLDDGVILNFAPLWRLVPQNRAWQKELRAAWASLVAGDYDWAHLSMRLWPERVVPKCAKDRSLAIAHDLEDVFWFEDTAGKWQPRPTPTRPLETLIAERTSPAAKAALASLLEAPEPTGAARRGRKAS